MDIASLTLNCNNDSRMAVTSKRSRFYATYRPNQLFSLPDSIIYYITKNPSTSKCYEKMIQSCKYFFIQNSILVISEIDFDYNNDEWVFWIGGKRYRWCNVLSKIWITYRLNIGNGTSVSSILPKIYQCDAKQFTYFELTLFFDDFKFLVPKCEELFLDHVIVKDENDAIVTLEKIIAELPKIKIFTYHFNDNASSRIVKSKTVTDLLKIPHFSYLTEVVLVNVHQDFDIEQIHGYIKKHTKTKIFLRFCDRISDACKTRLQKFANEILANENRDYKLCIVFPGMDLTLHNNLWRLYDRS